MTGAPLGIGGEEIRECKEKERKGQRSFSRVSVFQRRHVCESKTSLRQLPLFSCHSNNALSWHTGGSNQGRVKVSDSPTAGCWMLYGALSRLPSHRATPHWMWHKHGIVVPTEMKLRTLVATVLPLFCVKFVHLELVTTESQPVTQCLATIAA